MERRRDAVLESGTFTLLQQIPGRVFIGFGGVQFNPHPNPSGKDRRRFDFGRTGVR
jgi:hypothetical protein